MRARRREIDRYVADVEDGLGGVKKTNVDG
jgi:hypothetical protein